MDTVVKRTNSQMAYIHNGRERAAISGQPQVTANDQEIDIQTQWGLLLEKHDAPCPKVRELSGVEAQYARDGRLFKVERLFSSTECDRLIATAEAIGFGKTNYPKKYRGNLRLITEDQGLAAAVWERVRGMVPPTVELYGEEWNAVGLNECWRLAKYHPGDRFGAHCDSPFQRNSDEMSMFTVNAYMNDVPPECGGATRFYEESSHIRPCNPVLQLRPLKGMAVIFRQPPHENLLHDGEELGSGALKYLFRSDVMYRRALTKSTTASKPDSGLGEGHHDVHGAD
mmetsp:Transcript_41347/g.68778  ORF Transcript_41347/g.68778 Transcript_41347/m.68778 type:complete len:284 (-) Transcript_41347:341-1192(-)